MMLSIILAWVAAIVLAIMFICCGYHGYTKQDQPEIRVPGMDEGSSLINDEPAESKDA